MRITDDYVLKQLNVNRGEVLTLEDLDDKVQNVLDKLNSDSLTSLNQGYGADETLNDKCICYYSDEDSPLDDTVRFEVVEFNNEDLVFSKVKIL